MSGANTDYDPVEVTPLKAEEVDAMREAALAAIAGAGSLEELKRARIEHTAERSPLALANREIGALPPRARKDAGLRIGQARGAVTKALAARQAELEAEHEARMLVEETVDVTLPWDREPRGARHPLTTLQELVADVFVAMGWEVAEGPEVEAEWLNFDALNLGPDHPARTMQDTFWLEPPAGGLVPRPPPCGTRSGSSPPTAASSCARTPRPCRPARCSSGPRRSTSSVPVGSSAPTSSMPPIPPCSRRSRGWWWTRASRWPTSRAPWTTSPRRCSARASRPVSARRTSPSPSRPPRSTWCASSAGAFRLRWRAAGPARGRAGSSGAAAGW